MDKLLEEVGPEEVPFQPGMQVCQALPWSHALLLTQGLEVQMHVQASDLKALLSSSLHHPEKRLSALHTRIHKHLHTGSPDLIDLVGLLPEK